MTRHGDEAESEGLADSRQRTLNTPGIYVLQGVFAEMTLNRASLWNELMTVVAQHLDYYGRGSRKSGQNKTIT